MGAIQRRLAASPVAVAVAATVTAVAVTAVPAARAAGAPHNPLLEPHRVTAQRAAGPIWIDGVLDEPAWTAAQVAERFMQAQPTPGDPSRLDTSSRVVFDDAALYVGVRLEDPAAWAIQAPVGRRDDENASDWCFVEIDSRRDRRTAVSLGVNPAGVQVDGVFVDDTTYDASWNGVWEAATRVDAGGWTAEYRIPYALLAFPLPPAGEPLRWGINVYRHNPHTGESSNWSPRMPALAGVVSLFNELVVDAAPAVRRLDVTPYALTGDTTLTIAGMPGFSIARPDGAGRSLVANAVARWELAPGSFLTAVWSHRGDTAEAATTARLAGELGRAAREPGSDTVLVKLGWRWAP